MSPADDDRSLLFATLAARSGLISAAEREEALRRWASDRSRPLADVLEQLGALNAKGRAAVEQLMRIHLGQHGDDPTRSLRALAEGQGGPTEPGPWPAAGGEPSLLLDAGGGTIDPNATIPPAEDPDPAAGPPPADEGPPRFHVIRPHARGGLGEIFVARDEQFDREVALKEIQGRFADHPGCRARFLAEARITGNLEHPGIVPVYGLGRHADGRPYYAMRFVRGETLRDAIERFHRGEPRPGSPDDRALRLRKLIVRFLAVCDAVDYAHSRGVIHRDLKPSNILLGPHGETLVVDWGLAKPLGDAGPAEAAAEAEARGRAAGGPGSEATAVAEPPPTPPPAGGPGSTEREPTRAGVAVGTPAYMAPEQAAGDPKAIGPASDVYSLGATLATLLTGRPPGAEPGPAVADAAPPRPARRLRLRRRPPEADPALAAICARAMDPDPARRYPSARALADDLERWLADEPVSARREPWHARLGRWSRRHPSWIVAALGALLVAWISLAFLARARLERQAARAAIEAAERDAALARQAQRLQQYFGLLDRLRQRAAEPRPGWTWPAREELLGAARLRPEADADGAASLRSIAAGLRATFDLRQAPERSFGVNPSCLAFAPDGRTLALGAFKADAFLLAAVVLVDWPSETVIRRLAFPPSFRFQVRANAQDGARRLAFDPEGRWLAVGARSGWVTLWDLHQRRPRPLSWPAHDREILGLAFASGGDAPALLTCADDGPMRRWALDRPGQRPRSAVAEFDGHGELRALALGPAGALAGIAGGRILRIDPESLEPTASGPEVSADRLAFSPDGRMLAAGDAAGISLLSADRLRVIRRLTDPEIEAAHRGPLTGLAFSPDGALLASACSADDDRLVKVWDVSTGLLVGSVHDAAGTGYSLIDVAFTPDGGRLLASGKDRVAVIEPSNHPAYATLGLDELPVAAVAPTPDGARLARLGRADGALRVDLWDIEAGRRLSGVEVPDETAGPEPRAGIAVAPAGDRIAFHGASPRVFLWPIGSESPPAAIDAPAPSALQFSADGRRCWGLVDEGAELVCWDLERGERLLHWTDHGARVVRGLRTLTSLIVAEPRAIAGGRDGFTRLFHLEEDGPQLVRQWDLRDGPVQALALRPDGGLVASGTRGGAIVLIPLPEGVPFAAVADAHPRGVSHLAIAPDGRTLASGGADRAVRLWRIAPDALIPEATLGVATGPILDLDFTPDGRALVVAAEGEHALRLWRLDRLRRDWDALGIGLDP